MASISCQHIYKIYPGATAPSVTDFNLEIQDKEFIIFDSATAKAIVSQCPIYPVHATPKPNIRLQ